MQLYRPPQREGVIPSGVAVGWREAVERWTDTQPSKPGLSETIRRLVELEGEGPVVNQYWLEILIGSTIGGLVPELWGESIWSYTALALSTVGSLVGWWIGYKIRG
jgi:hypothetical protein